MKQQRNEPCACGSGQKYKRCCLKKVTYSSRATPKIKLTKEQKMLQEIMAFGKKSINPKAHSIQKQISAPKGSQREANIMSSNKRIEE